jgi:hypothetical protein
VRRLLIQGILPLIFCLVPPVAAALVAMAIPSRALEFYLHRIRASPIDWIILGLGTLLFLTQVLLTWRALQWRGTGFDERPDRWLSNLAQAAEWFPMLGLIGTVIAILDTFSQITAETPPTRIIELYGPAISATGSGLFMALINILPTWIVLMGRDVILTLGGGESSPSGETRP